MADRARVDYRDVVYEASNLTSTSPFCRIGDLFFHGFAPMRRGTYCRTVNAQHTATDYAVARIRKRAADTNPDFD